jgi:hypothetical protein
MKRIGLAIIGGVFALVGGTILKIALVGVALSQLRIRREHP